ncbi:MAG: MGMT family protein [Bacteroidetes bacterium]|nr:MGMT family protein [Bacteroidota bacterium]
MRRTKQRTLPDYFDLAKQKSPKQADFYARVYEVVARIPKGKVTSYGAIGQALGLRSSARVVGYAMGLIPDDPSLPAHRVLNRLGELSAAHKFGGYEPMRKRLEREGVTFKGRHVDMQKHFWDPSE